VRGRQLGLELKRLRTDAGLTADQAAESVGCSQGKISRIELAQTGVSKGDLFLMLSLYGITDSSAGSSTGDWLVRRGAGAGGRTTATSLPAV